MDFINPRILGGKSSHVIANRKHNGNDSITLALYSYFSHLFFNVKQTSSLPAKKSKSLAQRAPNMLDSILVQCTRQTQLEHQLFQLKSSRDRSKNRLDFALLCFALLCFALLYFALLCYVMLSVPKKFVGKIGKTSHFKGVFNILLRRSQGGASAQL